MLRLKDKSVRFPERYPKIERYEGTIHEPGWVKVNGVKLRSGVDYMPQPGLQTIMVTQDVDIQLLGGQAGGGKTTGLLLAALDGIHKTGYGCMIVKKQLVATKSGAGGIIDDAKRIFDFAGSEFTSSDNPTFTFPAWGTSIMFTHANFPSDTDKGIKDAQEKFKNFQNSRIFIDEATDHSWRVASYLLSRNRDSSGMSSKMIMTFNTNSNHWTRQLIDWWIDEDGHVIQSRIGKIRYALIRGESVRDIIWADTKEEIVKRCNIVVPDDLYAKGLRPEDMVKSVTFRPCKMAENMILMSATHGQHAANLFNLGETETNKLFYENWNEETQGEATISRQMIKNIWSNPYKEGNEMYASVDVAAGGDNCVMVVWRELTIVAIESFDPEGDYRKVEKWIGATLAHYEVPIGNMAFDATGSGAYLKSYTNGRAITANVRAIQELDEWGNVVTMELFYNLRSQLMGKMQFLMETGKISCVVDQNKYFPHGKNKTDKNLIEIMFEEADIFRRTIKGTKFYFKLKTEFKERYGYSPDYWDAITYRAIFEIDGKAKKEGELELTEADYSSLWQG